MQAAAVVAAAVCVVAGLALLPPPAEAHQFKFGGCKKANPMANFNSSQFGGMWFPHRKLATSSECMMITFDWDKVNENFKVREGRLPIFATVIPGDYYFSNAGLLTQVDPEVPAAMKLVWEAPSVIADMLSFTYTVINTDYDTFAVDVECQSLMGFAKRVSATVLTRNQTPPSEAEMNKYLDMLKDEPDVNLSRMSAIQQSACAAPDDATYNIHYDKKGFSLMSIAGNEELRNITTISDVEKYVIEAVENEDYEEYQE